MYIMLGLFIAVGVAIECFLLLTPIFSLKKKPHLAFVTLNKMTNESSVGFSKLAKQILFGISEMIG